MLNCQMIERLHKKIRERGLSLAPPLVLAEVESFESFANIRLPSDYREFLLKVGNGGSGPPEFGLFPLDQTISNADFVLSPSMPFPFTKAWVWEEGESSIEGSLDDVHRGVLRLGTDGCGQYWTLVVLGPEHGKIWMQTDVGIQPLNPDMSFTQWYEAWLDGKRDWWG